MSCMLLMFRSRQLFCELIQQACEKIDRTRAHAGEIFAKLLYHRLLSVFLQMIMVTLCNRADHYIFALWFLLLSSFFLT